MGKIEKEFLHFMKLVPDGGVILDIGANIGIMTAHIGKRRKNSTIYSFEPIKENCAALKRIIKYYKLKNVKVFQCALGDHKGEIKMVMPQQGSVRMQGLSHVVEDKADEYNKGVYYTVPLEKLDDFPELTLADKITAIKIDVENFEYFVLKGGEKLLERHKPVIYSELWDNETRTNVFNLLSNLGYQTKINEGDSLVDFKGQDAMNFIFIPSNGGSANGKEQEIQAIKN